MKWLQDTTITLIALSTVTTFLAITAFMVVKHPDHEITTALTGALVTVGFGGIIAFYLARDKGGQA